MEVAFAHEVGAITRKTPRALRKILSHRLYDGTAIAFKVLLRSLPGRGHAKAQRRTESANVSVRKRNWTTGKGIEKTAWVVDYADTTGTRRLKTFLEEEECRRLRGHGQGRDTVKAFTSPTAPA